MTLSVDKVTIPKPKKGIKSSQSGLFEIVESDLGQDHKSCKSECYNEREAILMTKVGDLFP